MNAKQTFITTALASVLALAASGVVLAETLPGIASTPISADGGVTPYIIDGSDKPIPTTCAEVGKAFFGDAAYYRCASDEVGVPFPAESPFANVTGDLECDQNTIGALYADTRFVSFTSDTGVGAAILKGAQTSGAVMVDRANVYVYSPQALSDSGLGAPPFDPVNDPLRPSRLQTLTFCWNPPEPAQSEWCSPGYWRQLHHLDSWEPTGYSPEDSFSAIFGYNPPLSKVCARTGATTTPTLWQVLQSPQCYGGEAFNAVGDLLSDAHPDVYFTGERVEDSCPLN